MTGAMGSHQSARAGNCPDRGGAAGRAFADHPHEDPGDGRTECSMCGKWVFLVIHSCKGVRDD